MSSNTSEDYDYDSVINDQNEDGYLDSIRLLYIVGYIIICVLGLPLNIFTITSGCFLYHKVKKTISGMWVLSLAVMHLLCATFLPLQLNYAWHQFNWRSGTALCKLSSYVTYSSMFTTATGLSLWSIRDIVADCRCSDSVFVKCISCRASLNVFMVLSSWTLGVVLGSPSLLSRELRYTSVRLECIDDYDMHKEKTTDDGKTWLTVVVLCRFLLGVLVPAFVMSINSCLVRRRRHHANGLTDRIICLIKVAYFVCWTPQLFLSLLQINITIPEMKYILPATTVLAAAHCCVNPMIYLLVGRSIKLEWMSEVSRKLADDNSPL